MSSRGFTLTEVMIVTVITVMLMGILTAAALQANLIFHISNITSELQSSARLATEKMLLDLRRVTNEPGSPNRIVITPNPLIPGSNSITYRLPSWAGGSVVWSANPITISLSPAIPGVKPRQLIRNDGVNPPSVLANNVQSVIFTNNVLNPALYNDELRITLTLQKTYKGRVHTEMSFTTVNMRN